MSGLQKLFVAFAVIYVSVFALWCAWFWVDVWRDLLRPWLTRRRLRDAKARLREDVTSRVEGNHRNYYRGGQLIYGHEIHRHDVGRN